MVQLHLLKQNRRALDRTAWFIMISMMKVFFLIQKCLIAITFRESKFLITSLLSIFFHSIIGRLWMPQGNFSTSSLCTESTTMPHSGECRHYSVFFLDVFRLYTQFSVVFHKSLVIRTLPYCTISFFVKTRKQKQYQRRGSFVEGFYLVVHIMMSGLGVVWRVEGMDEFEMKTLGCLTSSVVKKVACPSHNGRVLRW